MTVTDLLRAELGATAVQRTALEWLPSDARAASWVHRYQWMLVGIDATLAVLVVVVLLERVGGTLPLMWAPALAAAWLLLAALCGAYRPNILGAGANDLRAVCVAGVVLFAVVPLLPLAGVEFAYGTDVVAALAAVTFGACLARWAARMVLTLRRRSGQCTQSLFLAGDAHAVVDMCERIQRAGTAVVVAGFAVPGTDVEHAARMGLPVVGFDDDLETLDTEKIVVAAQEGRADGLLLAPGPGVDNDVLRRVARACEWHALPLFLAPGVVDVATSAPVTPVAGLPVLALSRPGPAGAGWFAKNVLDRLGAGVGLVLLALPLLATALAIRLDSRGPALFRQVRVGENGTTFNIMKFRTMHVGSEALIDDLAQLNENDGNRFKIRDDPRVTRLGRTLRSLSIDELPQLVNVLAGHMSLVGPRPPLPREVDAYTTSERRRLLVKPGMTGLWQIGGRSDLSWADNVRLDLRYVDSWSLPLDARILARTLPQVVRRKGAC